MSEKFIPKVYPAVSIREMENTLRTLLNTAPNFDSKLVAYVDRCTVERDGFDFYSWKYWGLSSGGSISAFASDVYNMYKRFRALENRDWNAYWKSQGFTVTENNRLTK